MVSGMREKSRRPAMPLMGASFHHPEKVAKMIARGLEIPFSAPFRGNRKES